MNTPPRFRYAPLFANLLAQTIFGLALYVTKRGMVYVNQDTVKFLAFRFTTGFLVMCLLVLFGLCKVSYKGKPVKLILLVGLCNPLISQVFETTSTTYAPLSQIGLLSSLFPIIMIVLAILLNREYPTRRQVLFICVTMAGLALVNIAGATAGVSLLGITLIFGSLIFIALSRTFIRRAGVYFTPFEIIFVTTGMGAFGFSAVTAVRHWGEPAGEFFSCLTQPVFLSSMLYMGIGSCIIAFILMTYASVHLPVAVFAGTGMLGKVLTIFIGIVVLKEPFGAVDIVGGLAMILGIIGVSLSYDARADHRLKSGK